MSAPQTNIKKQKRRHWASLNGMGIAVVVFVLLLLGWLFFVRGDDQAPVTPASETSGTSGQSEVTQPGASEAPITPEAVLPPATPGETSPTD